MVINVTVSNTIVDDVKRHLRVVHGEDFYIHLHSGSEYCRGIANIALTANEAQHLIDVLKDGIEWVDKF